MENIMDLTDLAFRGEALDRLSSQLHESRTATKRGLENAVPLSLAGLAEHAKSQDRAEELLGTIRGGNYPHLEPTEVTRMVQDPGSTNRVAQSGTGFLTRVFGSKLSALVDAVAGQSGLSRSSATTLLGLATPLVLGAVGKEATTRKLDARGLSRLLADEENKVSGWLPASFATLFGGGSAVGAAKARWGDTARVERTGEVVGAPRERSTEWADDVRQRGEQVRERARVGVGPYTGEPRKKSRLGWLLVALAALAALLLLFFAFARVESPVAPPNVDVRPPEAPSPDLRGQGVDRPEIPRGDTPGVGTPQLGVTPEQEEAARRAREGAGEVKPPPADPQAGEPADAKAQAPADPQAGEPADAKTQAPADAKAGEPEFTKLTDSADPLNTFLKGTAPVPQRFVLEAIDYDIGGTRVGGALLDRVAETLKQHPESKVRIEGHTDFQGTGEDNQVLSEQRAEAVKRYLVSKGVPEERISSVGRSENEPIAPNETPEGRAENRRVELVVTER